MNAERLIARLPVTVIGAALSVRLIDEWWSYLPAGIVEDLRDIGISYGGAGWLLGLLFAGGLVGAPLGVLADHVDRRLTAVTGALLLVAGLTTYALAAPFIALAVASVVMGAASDLVILPVEAALAEVAGDRLDRELGRQHALSFFGDLLGPLLLGIGAATALGWQGAFAVTAVCMTAFAGYLALTPLPASPDVAPTHRAAFADALVIARRRDVLALAVIELLLGPLDEPFLAFAVARAASRGQPAGLEQLLAAGVVLGGLIGSVLVARRGLGPAARRAGPVLLLVGAVGIAAVASLVTDVLFMTAAGVGMALVWAALHHRLLTVVPGRSATVSTVVGTVGAAGALTPAMVGVAADRWGLDAALGLYALAAAGVVLVSARSLAAAGTDPSCGNPR